MANSNTYFLCCLVWLWWAGAGATVRARSTFGQASAGKVFFFLLRGKGMRMLIGGRVMVGKPPYFLESQKVKEVFPSTGDGVRFALVYWKGGRVIR